MTSAPAVTLDQESAARSARQESVTSTKLTPVYWFGDVDGAPRLYREFVHGQDHGDPIATSIHYMLSAQPFDPDYSSVWQATEDLGTSISTDNVITVDIGGDAFDADLSPERADAAVQQLVFTATAAAWNAGLLSEGAQPRVQLLIDGRSDRPAFGHVKLNRPIPRRGEYQAPVWLISPQHGSERSSGELEISGVAEHFAQGLRWRVRPLDSDSAQQSGAVTEQAEDGLYALALDLPAGTYEVSVWGLTEEGERRAEDSKTFSVGGKGS
ncbi:GerMN domain-containing protein [Zhihengliuella flava]|uniref:GerMN domain-containing protein n=1 Tax=Zhihengliuella flava TaxID=1285193 RepID=A0A931GEC2_9MICC|nr:GerMN domain-containing protein [Zhihengliuella flava]MBG6083357.1 hypothetical protein [Zhihengliuella flava]